MAWTYEQSGVSIKEGNAWVETIKKIVGQAPQKNVVASIGGFAGLYRLPQGGIIAACCDGVGTKLEIARASGKVRGLGQDLVAMNVNDLVTCGARPLFFLDYLACGKLEAPRLSPVIEGVVEACRECGAVLLGGETAEMPGVYPPEGFDLAGFAVGLVDEDDLIDGSHVAEGDLLLGLPSSGLHSNGFSLVRKALLREGADLASTIDGTTRLDDLLLMPTRLYVNQALAAAATGKVKAMAHITGGGLEENVSRVLGRLRPAVDWGNWKRPSVYGLLASCIDKMEMRQVFNVGVGFVFIVSPEDLSTVESSLLSCGENPFIVGEVRR
ncbi:MAG: phosphoribosylformylglycinamidine cyclo-ligase [Synergistales bacterium]|nr:phosphoribosylformylglycinamidine cyclo-ligase [Synergistales bacterium]